MDVLKLIHVSKQFGGLKAVDDVSLCMEQGSLHGLIGPNGALPAVPGPAPLRGDPWR